MKLIDTHCHIYLDSFDEDLVDVLARARAGGVEEIFMPNIDKSTFDRMKEVEDQYPYCKSMVGLHPCSVKENYQEELDFVYSELQKGGYIAIGELGTDLYWDKTFWEEQKKALITQMNWAYEFDLPIVIHCRESLDITIEMVKEFDKDITGVFHCFTGNPDQAKKVIDMGFFLGIGGVSTFKNSGMGETLTQMDMNFVVLETDSPYLAPVPKRGKRNEPSYLKEIALNLAQKRGISLEKVATQTTNNALRLFSKA